MPTKKVAKKSTKKVTKSSPKSGSGKKTTKKTAKKTAKKVTKKTANKTKKKDLVYSNNQTAFWVTDGQILNSLLALRDAFDAMDKEVYAYHANGWQNDFAQWVEVVLGDKDCATELKKSKTPKSAKTVIVRHLRLYTI